MKAVVIEQKNKIVIKDIPIPEIQPGTALIKVSYCGLCGPTDECIIKGIHPRATFPLVVGHEFAGVIEKIDSDCEGFEIGQPVAVNPIMYCGHCQICKEGNYYICEDLQLVGIDRNGGFEEYCVVPVSNLKHIPDNLPLNIAAFAEPMAVGVHSVRGLGFQVGQTALVF